jgi:signal transduction histidine kinase
LVVVYVFIFAYAILRHQLLDIKIIIKKTLIFTGIFVSIYAVFAFFAFLGQIFFERFVTANRWLSMVPSVIIVTLTLRPLENFLVNVTDKYLFQKRYDYKELLRTFAAEVLSVLELDRLIKITEEKLAEIMKLEYCKMVIANDKDIKTEAELKIPISINNKQIGALLLGKKKSDEGYTHDDILILQSLSNTLAIAISNANLVDELTKAQIKIAEKDKMATIGTLAAGMAHEVRNPITTIRVFSEYVPDRLRDKVFIDKYRNTITKEVDKIDHIIQTLIDFSGEEEVQTVSGVSIYEAVEELVSIIAQNKDILGRIRFINNIPVDLAKISVNKEELDEVVLNLTQNAIHAIPGEGAITFNAEESGKSVIIEISDTGNGMSEETIAHIFDPFFTTKSKGFGLGLFVVKELVQRNKGEISVESILGKGTRFRIRFDANDHR